VRVVECVAQRRSGPAIQISHSAADRPEFREEPKKKRDEPIAHPASVSFVVFPLELSAHSLG
jgi:hypothetical protein